MARHSNSVTAYLVSAGMSDLLPHWISRGWWFPLGLLSYWSRQNPKALRLASVTKVVFKFGSKNLTKSGPVNIWIVCSNACCWAKLQIQAVFFFKSSLRGTKTWDMSGTYSVNCWTKPRNDLSSLTLVGAGKFLMDSTKAGRGWTPWFETSKPAKVTVEPISNLSALNRRLKLLHWRRTILILSKSSGMVRPWTRMSSTSFRHPGMPFRASSDRAHHSSLDADRPMGARQKRYRPCGKMKVQSFFEKRSMGIW